MLSQEDIDNQTSRLRQALRDVHGVRGKDLSTALKRAGRLLPAYVRKAGLEIVEVEKLGGNPKLLRRVDPSALKAAERVVMDHLDAIDVADRRKGKILGMLGVISFNIILVVAMFITWLVWAGYL